MTSIPRTARRFTKRFAMASRTRKPAEPSAPTNGPSSYAPGCEDRVSARARREANRREAWWRENRLATGDLFTRELLHVLDVLAENPNSGTLYEAMRFEVPVRRILMPKTEAHVYHATIDDEIVILAVWGARR